MPNINRVTIAGHLTRDPELKYSPKGTAIGSCTIAITEKFKSGEQWKEDTVFLDVDIFGKGAELMGQYLRKGSAVLFEGRIKVDQWDDKQTGQKRSKFKIVADKMHFLGKSEKQESSPSAAQTAAPTKSTADDSDEIPF